MEDWKFSIYFAPKPIRIVVGCKVWHQRLSPIIRQTCDGSSRYGCVEWGFAAYPKGVGQMLFGQPL